MTHAEIETELPWYVNGTASARARAAVEAELATCDACAADVAELRALRSVLNEIDAAGAGVSPYVLSDTLERIGTGASDDAPGGRFDARRERLERWWTAPLARRIGGGAVVALLAAFLVLPRLPLSQDAGTPPDAALQRTEEAPVSAPAAPPRGSTNYDSAIATGGSSFAAKLKPAVPASAWGGAAAHGAASPGAARDAASLGERQLARDGTIGLLVPDVAGAIAGSERIATQNFGLVTGLQDDAPTAAGDHHTAHLTLSVPDDRFSATLARLAALGGVTTRSVKTEDLTDSIVDADARLRNLRREEGDLLKIMDRSGRVEDILSVEQQLASTRQQIEELDAQSQAMRRRVTYATIAIDLSDDKTASAVPGPGAQIIDAWHAALRDLWSFTLGVIARLLELLAFAPYIVVLALAIFALDRLIRRKRIKRE